MQMGILPKRLELLATVNTVREIIERVSGRELSDDWFLGIHRFERLHRWNPSD